MVTACIKKNHAQYKLCDFGGYSKEIINMFSVRKYLGLSKTNIEIFSNTINITNFKVCIMVLLTEFDLFILFSVTLTIFQGHSNIKKFYLKILCSYLIQLKL